MEMTDDALMKRALEIREDIDKIKAREAATLEPYEAALQSIENEFMTRMLKRESKSISTEHGTAYKSLQTRVKMVNRDEFIGFILDAADVRGRIEDFITNHVSKEAVKDWLETHNTNPPGIETTTFTQCNIRKA